MTEPTRPCGECGMPCTPGEYHPYAACLMFKACHNSETVRANLEAVRGTPPAVTGEPDFYTVCARHEDGGEAGWIPLPGYSNETEHGVKHLVLEAARKEGYKGTAAGRLLELGWEIRPVFLTPQPTQAQAGAVPMMYLPPLITAQINHLRNTAYRDGADGEPSGLLGKVHERLGAIILTELNKERQKNASSSSIKGGQHG